MGSGEWERELRNYRKTMDWVTWSYYYTGCITLNLFFIAIGAMVGLGTIAVFDVRGSMEVPIAVLGCVAGWLLLQQWGKSVVRHAGLNTKDLYKIGSEVSFDFDPTGFRMRTHSLDWWTAWTTVHGTSITDKALIIRTPFSMFLLPLTELPLPVEAALERLRGWQQEVLKSAT